MGERVILVCGGRVYADARKVAEVLQQEAPGLVIQGGAAGADRLAWIWAKSNGVHSAVVDALWGAHGRAAGPIRNRWMLRLHPDLVIAFPGGRGTADMVAAANEAGIPVRIVPEEPQP